MVIDEQREAALAYGEGAFGSFRFLRGSSSTGSFLCGSLDSDEPFWKRKTVRITYRPIWRNSLSQFSKDRFAICASAKVVLKRHGWLSVIGPFLIVVIPPRTKPARRKTRGKGGTERGEAVLLEYAAKSFHIRCSYQAHRMLEMAWLAYSQRRSTEALPRYESSLVGG